MSQGDLGGYGLSPQESPRDNMGSMPLGTSTGLTPRSLAVDEPVQRHEPVIPSAYGSTNDDYRVGIDDYGDNIEGNALLSPAYRAREKLGNELTPTALTIPLSGIVCLAAVVLFFTTGMEFGLAGRFQAWSWMMVAIGSVVLAFGLDWCMVGRHEQFKSKTGVWMGMRVCCLILLFLFALLIMVCLVMMFYSIGINSPYRVDFEKTEELSKKVVAGKLDNGFRYQIIKNSHKAGKFSSIVRVEVGSMDETKPERGIAHFCEHLAFDQTEKYEGRGALFSQVLKSGADFNAFTTFQTTVYFFNDVAYSKEAVTHAMDLHREQVLHRNLNKDYVNQERGAILGEERMTNNTGDVTEIGMMCNHLGYNHRGCIRDPMGTKDTIKAWTFDLVSNFVNKWYRIDRATLFIAGDFDPKEVEKVVKATWGSEKLKSGQPATPPDHPPKGTIKPVKDVYIQNLDGVDGVEFHFLTTEDYQSPPYTLNDIRMQVLDKLFSMVYSSQVMARAGTMYPDDAGANFPYLQAGVAVDKDYSMYISMTSLTVQSGGDADQGPWKRDLTMALQELYRLAESGVSRSTCHTLLEVVKMKLLKSLSTSGVQDSSELVQSMLGPLDPNHVYSDQKERTKMRLKFLNYGFAASTAEYIRTKAKFLWKAVVSLAQGEEYKDEEYKDLPAVPTTLNVFVGRSRDPEEKYFPKITSDDIKDVIQAVIDSNAPDAMDKDNLMAGIKESDSDDDVGSGGGGGGDGGDGGKGGGGSDDDSDDLLPKDGTLVDSDATKPAKKAKIDAKNDDSGVKRYRLNNDVMVNIKTWESGREKFPTGGPGEGILELVSLGGKATQTPSLKGACEFVNYGLVNGYSVLYGDDGKDDNYDAELVGKYFKDDVSVPALKCTREFMSLQMKLNKPCVNFPKVMGCKLKSRTYDSYAEALRVGMAPSYDWHNRKSAADQLRDDRASNLLLGTADVYLDDLEDQFMAKAFSKDTRMQRVTAQDIDDLNMQRVTSWVREQFSIDRIEVNVAGYVNEKNIIDSLNKFIGTIPKLNYTSSATPKSTEIHRVGYDVYDPADNPNFQRPWPTGSKASHLVKYSWVNEVYENCKLPNDFPERGHNLVYLPSFDMRSKYYYKGKVKANPSDIPVIDHMAKWALFNSVRRDHSLAYGVELEAFHSIIFKNFGYMKIAWFPGPWPANTTDPKDPNNVVTSTNVVVETLKKDFDLDLFHSVHPYVESALLSQLQSTESWLHVMRGMGLKPPVTWSDTKTEDGFLKSVVWSDVVGNMKNVTHENTKDKVAFELTQPVPVWGAVETVDAESNPPSACQLSKD